MDKKKTKKLLLLFKNELDSQFAHIVNNTFLLWRVAIHPPTPLPNLGSNRLYVTSFGVRPKWTEADCIRVHKIIYKKVQSSQALQLL